MKIGYQCFFIFRLTQLILMRFSNSCLFNVKLYILTTFFLGNCLQEPFGILNACSQRNFTYFDIGITENLAVVIIC